MNFALKRFITNSPRTLLGHVLIQFMVKGLFPVEGFRKVPTPFYYYDTDLLNDTLKAIARELAEHSAYRMHYAVKACANPRIHG